MSNSSRHEVQPTTLAFEKSKIFNISTRS